MLSTGVKLGNRYRLDERIASGGMGDVWRGTDEVLGRVVAVKSLLPALLDDPDFAERFRGEARTMATINHPGVVDIYDFGSDQQIAFLVMEHVEGDALSATLNRVGRLTSARTMALVAQAADALHAAHLEGIVHRDVKPGNLLVRPNGTLVLTDFGIARSDLVAQLTAAGSVLGTASYISPEQATGAVATPASDVYALGVVAYQCLSGRRPFEGDNPLEIALRHVQDAPRALPADIPPQVRAVVERAMAKDPADRWPSAAALAGVARQLKSQLSQAARAAEQASPVSPAPGRAGAVSAGSTPGRASVVPAGSVPGRASVVSAAPGRASVASAVPAASAPGRASVPPPVGSRPPQASRSPVVPQPSSPLTPQPQARRSPVAAVPLASARPGHPPIPAPPRRSRLGRAFLVLLLAALVLSCFGMVSYLWDEVSAGPAGRPGQPAGTSDELRLDGRDDSDRTSYRRAQLPSTGGDETTTSEGRQTR
ncbi:serine/threonine-protein kinase [Salinispora fenicalii]|uniref:serine/threonine-protein kinase n=1 Tax=Salinispora fenicalii TaxID=1137263 RepID=UPI0004880008|nr:serine/threonine-protein kinase [Salinispora fenicalii]